MTDRQMLELGRAIRERTRRVKTDPEEARRVLRGAGILNDKGEVEPRYAGVVALMRSARQTTAD